jgi:branched-chain amino acid transport system permease protein
VSSTFIQRLTARSNRGRLISALVVALLLGYVIQESWAGNPITFDSVLFFLVVGVTLGSIYAVAAAGLVVTYTTSGIFNFAQGAIGMLMAFIYWEFKVDLGWNTLVALVLTVLVAAPLFGAVVERVLMRKLWDAPLVAQLVVTIGLMLAMIGFALKVWDPADPPSITTFFGSDGFQLGQTFIPWFRFITIVAGIVIAVVLRFVLYRTRLGIAMRAVVDNRELAALNGARPGRISMFSWALGSSLAAVAGIFLAEELAQLNVQVLTLLIIDAFAAAIIGRLKSLPLTYVGGIIIGLSISFQSNFLTWGGRWIAAAPAIPSIVLFIALLFVPEARIEGRKTMRSITARVPTLRRAACGMAVLLVAVFIAASMFDRSNIRNLDLALCTAFIMLSLVPLTGWSGQISLAQITFVGAGTFALVQWGPDLGTGVSLAAAALFAVPFGVLMALPALRLQGLYLALASMAFALMAKFVFFGQPEVFGSSSERVPPLSVFGFDTSKPFTLFGIDFPADAGLLLVTTVAFAIVGMLMVMLRRSAFGRRLVAMRDSPAACTTLGVNLLATKVAVFAISAAVAGLAGAFYGSLLGSASPQDFEVLNGLGYLLLLVVGGVAVVSGALLGGLFLQGFTWLAVLFPSSTVISWFQAVGPGLSGIGIGRQPEGVIPTVSEEQREKRARKRANRADASPPAPPPTAGPATDQPVSSAVPGA